MTVITHPATTTCDRESRITRSLLGYGVITGPVYAGVSLAQALTRAGFDPARDAWSLLSNGPLGWIQITNFVTAGLMTAALAVGLRRAGTGRWLPRLLGGYGASLIAAGIFRADPAGATTVSWHGMLHLMCGSIGFLCLILACLVAGRAFARAGASGWARFSRVTGAVFLAAFAGIAAGPHGALTTLPFTAAVILACAWVSALSVRIYRRTAGGQAGAA